jgi:hypothetical protein
MAIMGQGIVLMIAGMGIGWRVRRANGGARFEQGCA